MARRVTTKDKWKAKAWYDLVSPKEFGEIVVGETPASDPAAVVGRRVEVAGNELASGPRLNQVKLILEVESVAGNIAKTKLAGYELANGYVRSIVRRRRKRVDLVKNVMVDNQKVRIKAIAMTLGKSYRTQQKLIQGIMDEIITKNVEGKTLDELIKSILSREIQNEIRGAAKKIFPVASVEIRRVDFI